MGLPRKEQDQAYGLVTKMLGNNRVMLKGESGVEVLGTIRGSIRKKARIERNDIILYSIRDFDSSKVDILHKYSDTQIRTLRKEKELEHLKEFTEKLSQQNTSKNSDYNDDIVFDDEYCSSDDNNNSKINNNNSQMAEKSDNPIDGLFLSDNDSEANSDLDIDNI